MQKQSLPDEDESTDNVPKDNNEVVETWASLPELPKAGDEFLQDRPVIACDEGRLKPLDDRAPYELRALGQDQDGEESS